MNALRRRSNDPVLNPVVAAAQVVLIGRLVISAVQTAHASSQSESTPSRT